MQKLILLMCLFANFVCCQAQGYTQDKLDVTAESLPKGYKGQEPAEVSAAVLRLIGKGNSLKKDEFETTQEFEKRKQEFASAPVLGTLTLNDFFAIQLYTSESLLVYDADKGILKISILAQGISRTIPLTEEKKKVTAYEGQNAYGAKANITKIESVRIGLSWQNTKDFGAKDKDLLKPFEVKQELPMPLDVARSVKPHLRILAIFQIYEFRNKYTKDLNNLYGGIEADHKKATLRFPFETISTYYLINAKISEFWLYNEENGEILKKIRPRGK